MSRLDAEHMQNLKRELKALKLKFKHNPDSAILNRISELEGIIAGEIEVEAWNETKKILKKIADL